MVHAPILLVVSWSVLADGPDLNRIGNGIALVAANALFVLKLLDVAFRPTPRSSFRARPRL
jgi:hypothetical protein